MRHKSQKNQRVRQEDELKQFYANRLVEEDDTLMAVYPRIHAMPKEKYKE